MVAINPQFGWVPDRPRQNAFASEVGRLAMVSRIAYGDPKDVELWHALKAVHPRWRRGAQKIGDCVSWGGEMVSTALMALQAVKGESEWIAEAATESIYGGCRVEALGKANGGWSDGAFGASCAKWLRDWGVTLRIDYSEETGVSEHNLRVYSGEKAKQWGYYGCGGKDDGGKLDTIAKAFPIRQVTQVLTAAELFAAIDNGYPVTIASMAGFGSMKRDADGVCRISGRWPHQMSVLGSRTLRGKRQGRIFQSWGDSCSGPDPGIDWDAVSACSWWATYEDLDSICKSGDCWAFSDIEGFLPQTINFREVAEKWYNPKVKEHHVLGA